MCIVVKILRAEGLAQERDVVMKVAPGNRPPAALHDKKIVKYKPWNSTNTARQTSLAFCLEAFSRSTCAYAEHCGLRELSQHEIGTWGSWGRTCSSEMTFRHLQRSLQSLLRLHLYLGNSSSNWRLNDSQSSHKAKTPEFPQPRENSHEFPCHMFSANVTILFYVKEVLIVSPWIWGKFQTSALLPGDAHSWNLANTFEDAHTGIWVFSFIGTHTS